MPDAATLNQHKTSVRKIEKVAVFCGSNDGRGPHYVQLAKDLGAELVKRKIGLVYGGGSGGLMGAVAHTVVEGLGEQAVIGVIPEALVPREISGPTHGVLRVVPDMHTRKAMMAQEADAFIALPGGFGTLEELIEVVTWQQLGLHTKPVGILNMRAGERLGFFNHLLAFVDHCVRPSAWVQGWCACSGGAAVFSCIGVEGCVSFSLPDALTPQVAEGFIKPVSRGVLLDAATPGDLLDKLAAHTPPTSIIQMKREAAKQKPPPGT